MREKPSFVVFFLVTWSLFLPIFLPTARAVGCNPACDFEVDTNVGASEGTVRVILDGNPTPYTLNYTFSFANDTQHTIEVIDTDFIGVSGARYVFKEWYHNGQWASTPQMTTPYILENFTSSQNGPFIAVFDKQFRASFSFTDPSGQAISPPSSMTLQGPSTVTLSSYSDQWLSAAVWTVTDATWQGMPQTVYGTSTIDLSTGGASAQIPLRAYIATVRVVDSSNNPISGASLTVTILNGTVVTQTTNSQGEVQLGHIPLGTYTVNVFYQNQDMGSWVVDAAQNPVNTIQLEVGGGVSGPVISAFVLLTVLGLAMFLLLLAIKVRKPPPPPTI